MSGVIHFGRAARALTVSTLSLLALSLLPGCANRGDVAMMDDASQDDYSGIVSAREYGYVRPAREGRIAGRSVNRSAGGDVWGRVRTGMKLDLHAHARIDGTLERFRRDPRYLERLSQQASPYLPTIVAEIEKRGFPMELALLPHVESRYNPNATSPKAAGGMWQFMPYTAREMGLRLDSEYDERRDVVASTRAALDYLAQLNQRFNGDWELTMAAYNCGPARVEAAQGGQHPRRQTHRLLVARPAQRNPSVRPPDPRHRPSGRRFGQIRTTPDPHCGSSDAASGIVTAGRSRPAADAVRLAGSEQTRD